VSLGPAEILVILVIALLVFGPNRLPEIGRQVGRGMREFRKFQSSIKGDLGDVFADDATDHAEPAPTLPPREVETGATANAEAGDGTGSASDTEATTPPATPPTTPPAAPPATPPPA
jgi:sec-independent protein translocase protein TatA